jgi:hypothetical protein
VANVSEAKRPLVEATEDGGRVLYVDTPYLRAEIVDGVAEVWQPRNPNPVNLTIVNAHLAACKECPHAGSVTTTKNNRDVWTIKCKSPRKGCGTVSLRHAGRCPEGKW